MTTNNTANLLETSGDEIERFALEECIKRQRIDHRVAVMVFPAGRCELVIKFARLGARVTAATTPARADEIKGRILASGLSEEIRSAEMALTNIPDALPDEPYDIIVVRHGLCHLPYAEARKVVRQLMLRLRIGGKLYISILGLHSELADGYPHGSHTVEERFSELTPAMAKKYGISGKVCLYSERNLFLLLLEAGASVLRTLTTTYGNVKAVAVRV